MNIKLLKQISILSLILGAVLGLITLIPYLGIFSFLICTFIAGSIVLWYLQKLEFVGQLDTKSWSIYGAISGFVSFIGFSISFVPLATILGIIFKTSYYLGISIMFKMGFFILLLMIVFVALISALLNGFGAMSTSYILELYKAQKENESNNEL